MQNYETEAYYWLAVKRMAELLAPIDPEEGAKMAAEAEAYREDLTAAVERSIALSPVVLVRDGTYRSFIPFACHVRGFASGAWSWRRPGSGAHVGGLYWDATRTATDMLISYGGILSPQDRRVQGYMDVLEDRLFLENPKVYERTVGYDPEKHWFAHAGWNYQCSPDARRTSTWTRRIRRIFSVHSSISTRSIFCRSRATLSMSTRHTDRPTRPTKKPLS